MKNNTEQITAYINQALRLCNDFALSNAKSHLYSAINEIANIEKKRKRRDDVQKQIEKQNQIKKLKEIEQRKKFLEQLNSQLDVNIEGDQQET